MSQPDLPKEIIQNSPVVYCRMHGIPNLYQSPYKLSTLKTIINEIETSTKSDSYRIKKAFIYFNNDIDVSAVKNAKEMLGVINRL